MKTIPILRETMTDEQYLDIWFQVLERDNQTGKNGRSYDMALSLIGGKNKGQWWKWENGFGHLTLDMKNQLRWFAQLPELVGVDPDLLKPILGGKPDENAVVVIYDKEEAEKVKASSTTANGRKLGVSLETSTSLRSKRKYKPRLVGSERAKELAAWFRDEYGLDLEDVLATLKGHVDEGYVVLR